MTTPVAVDFMVPNNPESRQAAEVIQAMAAEAGFDMKIRVTEFAHIAQGGRGGSFPGLLHRLERPHRSRRRRYIFHKCKAPQNNGHFCNAKVDQWLDDARRASKVEDARRLSTRRSPTSTLSRG